MQCLCGRTLRIKKNGFRRFHISCRRCGRVWEYIPGEPELTIKFTPAYCGLVEEGKAEIDKMMEEFAIPLAK